MKPLKQYPLILSKTFPKWHPRAGEPTGFVHAATAAINGWGDPHLKLHTLRGNYERWKKIFEEIDRGEACLVLKQWSGVPYRSKQETLAVLTREDGIGVQKLVIIKQINPVYGVMDEYFYIDFRLQNSMFGSTLAKNDGLSDADWEAWFKDADLSESFAIIHFTKFRY